MASLNLGNTCKGHITFLPAVSLSSKYTWEGTEGGKEVKYLYALM